MYIIFKIYHVLSDFLSILMMFVYIFSSWNWNSIKKFITGYHNYTGSGEVGDCYDKCFNEDKSNFCRNEGICLKDKDGDPYCQCAGSFTGKRCEEKSEFAYIAGGVAGSVIFLILLVLLIWMICVRANRTRKTPEKILGAAADQNGSQVS